MSQIKITSVPLRQLNALRQQFITAAHNSFSYLPPDDRDTIMHQNRLSQLVIGKLHPKRIILTATRNNQLLGYAIGSVERTSANLYWLYVRPDTRGQNVGLKLVSALRRCVEAKGATQLVLSTYDHERFYARQGFETTDTRQLHGVKMKIMRLRFSHEK
jgi:GNAT superfamily N-acetyltransferase